MVEECFFKDSPLFGVVAAYATGALSHLAIKSKIIKPRSQHEADEIMIGTVFIGSVIGFFGGYIAAKRKAA